MSVKSNYEGRSRHAHAAGLRGAYKVHGTSDSTGWSRILQMKNNYAEMFVSEQLDVLSV